MGTGLADINTNRDECTPSVIFKLGRNPQGLSDRTVWVVKLESAAGEPVTLLVNYFDFRIIRESNYYRRK